VADFRAATPSAAAELVMLRKSDLTARVNEYRQRSYLALKTKIEALERSVTALKDSYVLRAPMNVFLQMGQQVDDLLKTATSRITHLVELKRRDLAAVAGKIGMLSPLAVLDRGYSITFKDGKIIKTSNVLEKGDKIRTKFATGEIESVIS